MYIIQMADLHIGAEENRDHIQKVLFSSVETIQKEIPEKSDIWLCICGDIIDSKSLGAENSAETQHRYQMAQKLIQGYVKQLEKMYTIQIGLCVGNHDITHIDEFAQFVNALINQSFSTAQLESCYQCMPSDEGIAYIYVNSCMNNDYQTGGIDYNKLEDLLKKEKKERKKIIILHHTIMSMFQDDDSAIRNAADLVVLAERYNVIAILHGHIHGKNILKVGQNQCKIIGAGALFTHENPDVNSQFNIIKVSDDAIEQVINCRYNADDRYQPWSTKIQFEELESEGEYIFGGTSFQESYEKLLHVVEKKGPLSNISIEIRTEYDSFHNTLHEYLDQEFLEIGDKRYNYFSLAEMWEADQVPQELYFNHGSYFYVDGRSGIDYVTEQLKNKPTSNRIVLPTYNMKTVIESLGDKAYLPSLESIQFGKRNADTLAVHMQLRALEVCRFLKINVCEIDYILSQLRKKGVEFEKVDIVISAFQVQKREKFNCFLKAQIDTMPTTQLCAKVMSGDIACLCSLLKEKQDGMETITKKNGLNNLYEAMQESNEAKGLKIYPTDLLEKMKRLLGVYEQLDSIHQTKSVREESEKECEQTICTLLGEIIQLLKESEEDRKK